jgi:glycosyltransferase involved in cell wall biosynthesis
MPAYNAAATIERAVNSVTAQTFLDWELIIVDDASTDATPEILTHVDDARIRVLHHAENLERSSARNTGIAASRGRYICFLDSDDRYLSSHLSVVHEWLSQHDCPVVMTFTRSLRETPDGQLEELPFDLEAFVRPSHHILGRTPITTNGVCIHSEILRTIRFDVRLRRSQDSDLYLQIGEQYEIIGIDECTCVCTDREGAYFYSDAARLNYEERLRALRAPGSRLRSSRLVSRRDRHQVRALAHLGLANIHRDERPWLAAKEAASALLNSPAKRTKEALLLLLSPLRRGSSHRSRKSQDGTAAP